MESDDECVDVEVLTNWLTAHGYGEEIGGYGHATSEAIAEGLLVAYFIKQRNR